MAAGIARAAAFLVSEEADYVTGQALGVAGGRGALRSVRASWGGE